MAFKLRNLVRAADHSHHIVQPFPSFSLFRRGVHASVYEKNPEGVDISGETMVTSGKYWGPHPKTGIFGPPAYYLDSLPTNMGEDSVLGLKVWSRSTSLEDVEKPM